MEFGGETPKVFPARAGIVRSKPVYEIPSQSIITLDGLAANKFRIKLLSNTTINFVNWLDDNYLLHLIQGGAGSFTVTWGASIFWSLDVVPILSTAAGKRDLFSFTSDSGVIFGSFLKGYAK